MATKKSETTIKIKTEKAIKLGVYFEAIDEGYRLQNIRGFVPKSHFENELLSFLEKYPPILSFLIYLLFEKIKHFNFSQKKEDYNFFINLEVLYLISIAFEEYNIEKEKAFSYLKEVPLLADAYTRIITEIKTSLFGKKGNGLPNRDNLYEYMNLFNSFVLENSIKSFMFNFRQTVEESYSKKFFTDNITDFNDIIMERVSTELDTNFKKSEENLEPALISTKPPIWLLKNNSDNLLTGYIAKKMGTEVYKTINDKNLFYYWLLQKRDKKTQYLAKKLQEIFIVDEIRDKQSLEVINHLFDNQKDDTFFNALLEYVNLKKMDEDFFQEAIMETPLRHKKQYTKEELSLGLLQTVYKISKILAKEKDCQLFYFNEIKDNEKILLKLATLIRKGLSHE